MRRESILAVLLIGVTISPVLGQASKKKLANPKQFVPKVGAEATVGTFKDGSTEVVGGRYGIVRKSGVSEIVRLMADSDTNGLKRLVSDREVIVLPSGTRVLVGGFHQEMTKVYESPRRSEVMKSADVANRIATAGLKEEPKPIGPLLAHVKVLDGDLKDQYLWVPIAYLAPSSSVPAKKATPSYNASEAEAQVQKPGNPTKANAKK